MANVPNNAACPRRTFRWEAGVLLTAAGAAQAAPTIVLISCDDAGWPDLGR